jgi:hypothetical protein
VRHLTSTKREFTALGRRLYRRRPLSVNRRFRGVIERGFGVWIRGHWGLSSPGLFRPVEREFQTQQKPFALLNWPQPRRSAAANYTFSPTLHLPCFPQQTNNSFFELDSTGILQTLTMKQQAGPRNETVRNVLVERALHENSLHWLSSLRNLRVLSASVVTFLRNREAQRHTEKGTDRSREYHFLDRIFHTFNRESNTRRQSTGLTFSKTVGEVMPSRDVKRNLRSEMRWSTGAPSLGRNFAVARSTSATLELRNPFFTLPPSISAGNSNGETANGNTVSHGRRSSPRGLQSTTNLHTHLDHQFLISAKGVQGENKSHYGSNVFTTLALNFAAPRVSEAELVAKRISQFVSSPELTHIKRQQAISEETINALRGLRMPRVEPPPVTVPAMPSIEQLTNQVRTQMERELRIERERRGL